MQKVDNGQAINRLMRFLAVEGVTGREAKIGKDVVAALKEVGVPARAIRFDDANKKIPVPTETGNLIVDLPGRGRLGNHARLLFMTHLDTVPLCAGAKPKIQGRKIVNTAKTALGGDNRTGCGVLVTLAAELAKQNLDHPPLTLLFTVREESGLWGARFVDPKDLGGVAMGFNYDGRSAAFVTVGAVGADRWEVEITGRAAHAGGAPERGISSTLILAEALTEARRGGWFGKVVHGDKVGTSNVGVVAGVGGGAAGDATNVVTDYVHVRGESRSHDAKFHKEITAAYKAAFEKAAAGVTNVQGQSGKAKFVTRTDYHPFRLKESLAVVQRSIAAVKAQGIAPEIRVANGGLDANWLVRHKIPTVTFGAGQNEPHTVDEWIDLREYEAACGLALQLATMS
jgi:tripeptide aminopeptidase